MKTVISEQSKNQPRASAKGEYFGDIVQRGLRRRAFLGGAGAVGATLTMMPLAMSSRASAAPGDPGARLSFETVPPGNEVDVVVPTGYEKNVIIRWGDPLFPDAPEFDVNAQTPASQARQFGYNCDFVGFYPLPRFVRRDVAWRGRLSHYSSQLLGFFYSSISKEYIRSALLAVNHEYTSGGDMFPGYDPDNPTQEQVETEIESHGLSVVEIKQRRHGGWRYRRSSSFNRRITGTTPMSIVGPLRGHDLMKTSADPKGKTVLGMFNNCAGGKTPWGSVLTCEENFDQYFGNNDGLADDHRSKQLSERIAPPGGESGRKWERFDPRFDRAAEPNEYNRFGYVVEIDPYDPTSTPRKLTALGRFKHEGAVPTLARNGKVVVYSGDDARFEYVYKFVSKKRYKAHNRKANSKLLEQGTLYVARFDTGAADGDETGIGEWMPLVFGEGPLTPENGFNSQEEVLLNARGAADLLGATRMDRPEDIDVSPTTGGVYIALTNNSRRAEDDTDDANPRGPNPHGHVIELLEHGGDAASLTFRWNVLIKCGDPAVTEHETRFGEIADPVAAGVSPISDPDNVAFDDCGNLWIATDGQYFSGSVGFGQNDGVFAVPVEGTDRGLLRQFLSGVPGGEVCGPEFSGDSRSFFCAIQHPNDGEAFDKLWPVDEPVVSKPSVIGVWHCRGKKIGS